MKTNDSEEDIYNSLPVDCFTFELDHEETDSLATESDGFSLNSSISELNADDSSLERDLNSLRLSENEQADIDNDGQASLQPTEATDNFQSSRKEAQASRNTASQPPSSMPSVQPDESVEQSLWIRCTRCGKKNDMDCNFCGKCGLQIHKVTAIVEVETDESVGNEVARNIKYHYKRPVFCFGPRGYCFSSFSSPSKSVRNVDKFKLSHLSEFKQFIVALSNSRIILADLDSSWSEKQFNDSEWKFEKPILRTFSSIVSSQSTFCLDESLRAKLREYFANITPEDLGSIKNLAVQETVHYLRGEIDQIFHFLVLGKTKEATDLCIRFKYWDHALIIAKTLDLHFYEEVMNRFLDARFSHGHPLRTLYLIMTCNDNLALDEIRSMIKSKENPRFVLEIWMVLANFLLRASKESRSVSKIFEDIANCLFEFKSYENALVCYIISVLAGSDLSRPELTDRIDYLISWSVKPTKDKGLGFSALPVLNLLVEKLVQIQPSALLSRSRFAKLFYSQYLYDLGVFSRSSILRPDSKTAPKSPQFYNGLFIQEIEVLKARNMLVDEPISKSSSVKSLPKTDINPAFSPAQAQSSPTTAAFHDALFSPGQNDDSSPRAQFTPADQYSPIFPEPVDQPQDNRSGTSNYALNNFSDLGNNKKAATAGGSSMAKTQEQAGVLGKLKLWLPSAKTTPPPGEMQKQPTKANLGKPSSMRYDSVLRKWVDDSDPSTFEEAPRLPPPPVGAAAPGQQSTFSSPNPMSFRAKKGKVKYFDPLNPEGIHSSELHPSIPSFDS